MTDLFTTRASCRSCGGDLLPLLDLGSLVLSDFLRPDAPDPPKVPLTFAHCEACGLAQLLQTTNPEFLYRQYWYLSGVNEVMKAELADVVRAAVERVGGLAVGDAVLDVGANDGTLLSFYPPEAFRIGVEPADNLQDTLAQHTRLLIHDFFPSKTTRSLTPRTIKILTSIACFYDLDDPKAFVAEVDRLLTPDGVWVVQFQDLAQMVAAGAYDNIGHEHLGYYSLRAFDALLENADLHITGADQRAINGGSLRVYVERRDHAVHSSALWQAKRESGLDALCLEHFAWQAGQHRTQLQETLGYLAQQHGVIDMYAASTKSSTLLQYCGFDHTLIRQAAERSPAKWGRVTSGTRIPCVSEAIWRADPAPICLVAAWQFAEAFAEREAAYLAGGGQFLVPLPSPEIVCGA